MKYYTKIFKPLVLVGLTFSFLLFLQLFVYASEKEDSQAERKADIFIYEGPAFLGNTIIKSKSVIINRLGKPRSIKSEKAKNPHNDSTDTIYELFYEGLYVKVYEVSLDDRSFILHIILENNKYKTKWGLNVGTAKEIIGNVLGEPDEKSDTSWTFVSAEGYPSTVKFYFERDRVRKIEWSYVID
jgi:hypothetical protein